MKIKVFYGKDEILIDVPKGNVKDIIYPNKVEKIYPEKVINYALDNPVGMKSFDEFLVKNKDILFVVNDGTRPTPTAAILKILNKRMALTKAKYIIATGIHLTPTEEEYIYIFGDLYNKLKSRIIVHNGMSEEGLVYKGYTKNGTEIWINKNVYEAGGLIPIGSVEPHYFGGFTGGRKFLLPGLAGYRTIEQNHRLVLREGVEPLKLRGNPVHEDFIDALKTLKGKPIFSIQTVLNREKCLYAVAAGDINDSFYAAIKFAKEVFCVQIKEKSDIVVTVAPYPMDVDLYQSLKATDYGKLALKENGILILISKCRNGIGPSKFYELLSSSNSLKEVFSVVNKEYKLGYHIAAKIAELNSWAKLWGVTELKDEIMKKAFIRPFRSIQKAIDEAINLKGKNAKITFLMDGSITIPIIK